eukprot:INCI15398.2.p2 GENE.INCI15398.2~~INCI15398.2.p2  ORF type:complete len:112 (+),score=24.50 INCI15398.2:25-336(+)
MGGGHMGAHTGAHMGSSMEHEGAEDMAEQWLERQEEQGKLLDEMVKLGFQANVSPERMLQAQMCMNVDDKYKAMCEGYAVYLSECPSFLHDICHEVRLDVFLL